MNDPPGEIFPTNRPSSTWCQFPAQGFSAPACGVVYRLESRVTCGMPLGGIDTGCIDLDTTGLLGYCTIFNTHVPRRGPVNLPLLGLSTGGESWVLCDPSPRDGEGGSQHSASGRPYNLWRGDSQVRHDEPITPIPTELNLNSLGTAKQIHYWGHYPVADLEFETSAPISVGLRAFSPFLPGNLIESMLPGILFEVYLRNQTNTGREGCIAVSFPGPTSKEAGVESFSHRQVNSGFAALEVAGEEASYALGTNSLDARFGGELGSEAGNWARIAEALPEVNSSSGGSSTAVDFSLGPGQRTTKTFFLTWHAPRWNAGGYNWAGAEHLFTHMYAKYYTSPASAADVLIQNQSSFLRRILAWQQTIYSESSLPVWLRDSLVNNLHLIAEDGMWAQAAPPLPEWVRTEDGLFGMNECPRGCPQIECIPCSFYGNQPLVYFFPELALSTLRGYKGYQYGDGAPPWIFGGCTGKTPPVDFANPTRGYQFATNGISLAAMIDRYYLCHGSQEFVDEFYPVLKAAMLWTVGLRTTQGYSIGDRVIAMPNPDSEDAGSGHPTEWFEAREPGWFGVTAHVGGLHLAQLRITERFARLARDDDFLAECSEWIKMGVDSMEKRLWRGTYYANFFDPVGGKSSDLIFGYQLDGEWIISHHGLPAALPSEKTRTTLKTIRQVNVGLSKHGAVNYANPDGTPAQVGGYGTYSFFPPEALMLAMTYMYEGQAEFGAKLAEKVWENIVCEKGYTWDMPNIMRGDEDTGERTFGNDYYQDMMLWSLPAAIMGQTFGEPCGSGGLVKKVIHSASGH